MLFLAIINLIIACIQLQFKDYSMALFNFGVFLFILLKEK